MGGRFLSIAAGSALEKKGSCSKNTQRCRYPLWGDRWTTLLTAPRRLFREQICEIHHSIQHLNTFTFHTEVEEKRPSGIPIPPPAKRSENTTLDRYHLQPTFL